MSAVLSDGNTKLVRERKVALIEVTAVDAVVHTNRLMQARRKSLPGL
jgi:hypothetical protein